MSPSDPFSEFGDQKRTRLYLDPGGRKRQSPEIPSVQPIGSGFDESKLRTGALDESNPLIASSFSMLSLVPKLRNLPFHNAINELKERMSGEIKGFETRALQKGASQNQVYTAKYFLCTLIDATVLNTPWGKQSGWSHNTLSSLFFRELFGGERFFQIVKELKQQPAQNLDLLELAYLCLSLGFEGKYRHSSDGLYALEKERQDLYLLIQKIKGDFQPDLSIHWQGLGKLHHSPIRDVPLWVFAVVAGVLLMLVYMGFFWGLGKNSDRVYADLINMKNNVKNIKPVQFGQSIVTQRLPDSTTDWWRRFLKEEIEDKKVAVLDGPILRISDSFPSGGAQIKEDFIPMLVKIAQELGNETTRIEVIGHTDNQRIIFSTRFKSNWELSMARAKNVANILKDHGSLGERISFEGMADKEPITLDNTPVGRKQNRRVDIYIR